MRRIEIRVSSRRSLRHSERTKRGGHGYRVLAARPSTPHSSLDDMMPDAVYLKKTDGVGIIPVSGRLLGAKRNNGLLRIAADDMHDRWGPPLACLAIVTKKGKLMTWNLIAPSSMRIRNGKKPFAEIGCTGDAHWFIAKPQDPVREDA